MQTVIDFIVGLMAAIAAIALAQFGVDVNTPRHNDHEIHRMADCGDASGAVAKTPARPQNC